MLAFHRSGYFRLVTGNTGKKEKQLRIRLIPRKARARAWLSEWNSQRLLVVTRCTAVQAVKPLSWKRGIVGSSPGSATPSTSSQLFGWVTASAGSWRGLTHLARAALATALFANGSNWVMNAKLARWNVKRQPYNHAHYFSVGRSRLRLSSRAGHSARSLVCKQFLVRLIEFSSANHEIAVARNNFRLAAKNTLFWCLETDCSGCQPSENKSSR